MHSRALPSAILAGVLLAAACGGDRPTFEQVIRSDSAGIEIVENAPDWSSITVWLVDYTPSLQIGAARGDTADLLFGVSGVARLGDGRIVVANTGTNELRVYRPDGTHLRTLGGTGGGPGEYRSMGNLLRVPGDSILVEDRGAQRLDLYDANLNLVRSWPIAELPLARWARFRAGRFTTPTMGRLSNGHFVVLSYEVIGEAAVPPAIVHAGVLLRYSPTGQQLDTIGTVPDGPSHFTSCGPLGGICDAHVPFRTRSRVAVSGNRIFSGNGDRFEVTVRNESGAVQALWRWHANKRPVLPPDVEKDRALLLEGARSEDARRQFERRYAEVPIPREMPAFSRLFTDSHGNLWVEDYRAPYDAGSAFVVLSPEGIVLARVAMPADFDVHEIGADYVLGIWNDEAGVEYVRLHGLKRK